MDKRGRIFKQTTTANLRATRDKTTLGALLLDYRQSKQPEALSFKYREQKETKKRKQNG